VFTADHNDSECCYFVSASWPVIAEACVVISEPDVHPSSVYPRLLCWGPFRALIGALSLCRSHFSGSYMRHPSFHSVGISTCSHIFPIRSCNISVKVSISVLIARQEFCLGQKFSLSSCDQWRSQSLPYIIGAHDINIQIQTDHDILPDPGNKSFRWSLRHNQNEDITLMSWRQPATV